MITHTSEPRVRRRRAVGRRSLLSMVMLLMLFLLQTDGITGEARTGFVMKQAIGGEEFRLAAWEAQALAEKAGSIVHRPGEQLSPDEQRELVLEYLSGTAEIGNLSASIGKIYADPKEINPAGSSALLHGNLRELRADQALRRPTVERILEQQITDSLREAGLLTAGTVLPPVLFQFTESPDVLLVSPRERIELERSHYLVPGQPIANMDRMEQAVSSALNVSTLVEGTGGFSAYPTMVIAVPDVKWILSTIAHEWVHTYLFFRPLGWHYFDNGETRTLNETTASIAGDELGEQAFARYYQPWKEANNTGLTSGRGQVRTAAPKPFFDYYGTMRATRLRVDSLLAAGRVEEAEAYMEEQRLLFVANGYHLRKLNQAYFAFHGSYAVGPAATDPIGDKLRALRERSPDLRSFLKVVERITSVADLDAALVTAK